MRGKQISDNVFPRRREDFELTVKDVNGEPPSLIGGSSDTSTELLVPTTSSVAAAGVSGTSHK